MISRKICLLGAFSVGKSSLMRRFVHEVYDDRYVSTLGVKIETKLLNVDGDEVKLIVWDMEGADPGQKNNQLVTPRMKAYLQGVHGVLLIADGTRPLTIDVAVELCGWMEAEYPGVPLALLLNKSDLGDEWQVSDEKFDELSKLTHCFTTSALSGENVESTFEYLAEVLKNN